MNNSNDVITPELIKDIEDMRYKITLVKFLVKLMPRLEPYMHSIRITTK